MPAVTPLMVKELREKTGAGMLDCKKALEATDCNIEDAITWLREKGIAKAEKKASRIAAEGLADVFWQAGIPCVGPKEAAAQLEASKDVAKTFMHTKDTVIIIAKIIAKIFFFIY